MVTVFTFGVTGYVSIEGGYNKACSRFFKHWKYNPKRKVLGRLTNTPEWDCIGHGIDKHYFARTSSLHKVVGSFERHPDWKKGGYSVCVEADGKIMIARSLRSANSGDAYAAQLEGWPD